jgi:hypothetical protein
VAPASRSDKWQQRGSEGGVGPLLREAGNHMWKGEKEGADASLCRMREENWGLMHHGEEWEGAWVCGADAEEGAQHPTCTMRHGS